LGSLRLTRPLIISDCDEVLLHMIAPFRDWLAEAHDVRFTINGNDFARSMHRADGSAVEQAEMWRLLGLFFDTEMPRQRPSRARWKRWGGWPKCRHRHPHQSGRPPPGGRTAQLADHGLHLKVYTNQGPKAPPSAPFLMSTAPPAPCSSTISPSTTVPPRNRPAGGPPAPLRRTSAAPHHLRLPARPRPRPDRRLGQRAALARSPIAWRLTR
jgi:hypothetical protein